MARISRVVAVVCPHHVMQLGNRRRQTFFSRKSWSLRRKVTELSIVSTLAYGLFMLIAETITYVLKIVQGKNRPVFILAK